MQTPQGTSPLLAAAVLPIAAIVAGTVSYDALGTPSDLVLPPGMQTPQGTSPP
jgi:hypothetical protein